MNADREQTHASKEEARKRIEDDIRHDMHDICR